MNLNTTRSRRFQRANVCLGERTVGQAAQGADSRMASVRWLHPEPMRPHPALKADLSPERPPLTRNTIWRPRFRVLVFLIALAISGAMASKPAHADFFDDMRTTFKTDIPHFFQTDVPHFFQDDIPCAFGGKPTSGARNSCKSDAHPAKPAIHKAERRTDVSSDNTR